MQKRSMLQWVGWLRWLIQCILLSIVQTVSPNPILCISGWNLIWITDCPHSISQLSISDLCVHKRFFIFTECALVSMVMPLRCYAYAKNNSNSNTVCNTDVLPSRLRCSSSGHAGSFNMRLYSVLPSPLFSFFFCLHYFQNTKRCMY